MEILKIAGLALTGVLLASLMKSVHKEFSIYIILATVIVVFLMILDKLTEVFVFLQSIYDSVPLRQDLFSGDLQSAGSGVYRRSDSAALQGCRGKRRRRQSGTGRESDHILSGAADFVGDTGTDRDSFAVAG